MHLGSAFSSIKLPGENGKKKSMILKMGGGIFFCHKAPSLCDGTFLGLR